MPCISRRRFIRACAAALCLALCGGSLIKGSILYKYNHNYSIRFITQATLDYPCPRLSNLLKPYFAWSCLPTRAG
ncbi:twin-arginine translocation signal domain-containing protein [Pontibacter litorisediminis]|uniref:twin-arginine translocation signal domain-containing protein n=1 Tax=Pontibacter litorisediminis TaxID=1846260 RepID=UPI003B845D1B